MKLYNNCMDCPHHKVEHDPDPTDSFCDDDQAVLCTLAKNINNQHRWCDNHVWDHRPITWSCRPHHKRAYDKPNMHIESCADCSIQICWFEMKDGYTYKIDQVKDDETLEG